MTIPTSWMTELRKKQTLSPPNRSHLAEHPVSSMATMSQDQGMHNESPAITPGSMLGLQRSMGNRAVSKLMSTREDEGQSSSPSSDIKQNTPPTISPVSIQRAPVVQRQSLGNVIQRNGGFFSKERTERRHQKIRHSKALRGLSGAAAKTLAFGAKVAGRIKNVPTTLSHGALSLEGMSIGDLEKHAIRLIKSKGEESPGAKNVQLAKVRQCVNQQDKAGLITIIMRHSVSHDTVLDIGALQGRSSKQKLAYRDLAGRKRRYHQAKRDQKLQAREEKMKAKAAQSGILLNEDMPENMDDTEILTETESVDTVGSIEDTDSLLV